MAQIFVTYHLYSENCIAYRYSVTNDTELDCITIAYQEKNDAGYETKAYVSLSPEDADALCTILGKIKND